MLCDLPLKCRCSRKCALPEVSKVSSRDPAPTNTPTADVELGQYSVATRTPFERVVISNGRTYFKGSGTSPKGSSP